MKLQQRAERLLDGAGEAAEGVAGMSPQDISNLIHELRVHQIELKVQNDELRRIQAELEKARDRYVHLYDFAPTGYFTVDGRGVILEANLTAAAMLGRQRAALVGEMFSRFIHRKDQDTWYLHRKHLLETGDFQSFPLRLLKNDCAELCVNLECLRVEDSQSELPQIRIAVVDITALKQAEEALKQLNETLEQRVFDRTEVAEARARQLCRLTAELALTEERERRRLAGILHDHLQQLLVGIRFSLDTLTGYVATDRKHALDMAYNLLAESIETSRSITAELSPPILYQNGLVAGLEWLCRWMQEKHGFSVELQMEPDIPAAQENTTVVLFQSVRELLFNAVKHSGVNSAKVVLSKDGSDRIRLLISDAGKGFDPDRTLASSEKKGGFGLISIRERMEFLGGRFEAESTPGKGTSITLIGPVEGSEAI